MSSQVALVTGSSRGIGAAIATQLVHEGWQVILHGSAPSECLNQLQTTLGTNCLGAITADLKSPQETSKLWTSAQSIAPINALVNNAGIYTPLPFHADQQAWLTNRQEMFRVNFEAPSELMYSAITSFQAQGGGKILNVASRVGFRGEANASMYAASKAAIINLTRSLAVEYANTGIELFGIAPGWVATSMSRDGMEDRLPEILSTIPMGRMASPEDCAVTASFLLSQKASYLSGVVIDINGASYFH
jgi:3-oxoacyl-[acyl-carrier protein] reductase